LIAMVVGAVLFARAYQNGAFKDEKKVVDLSKRETVTSKEATKKKEELEQALSSVQVDPAARDAAIAKAEAAIETRNLVDAREAYGEALLADPTSPKALQGLAIVAMQQKDYTTAANAFEKLMTLDEKYRHQFAPMHARAKKLAEQQQQ
jgi:tetratricopeptide (TPR) repeat protein